MVCEAICVATLPRRAGLAARDGPGPRGRPVIVVLNHASWWDPLIGLVLSESMPVWRVHFAPIEARGLSQYRFLERLGFFGIDTATPSGGLTFLRTSLAILSRPEASLWITAQGEFVDARERPIDLKPGIGHLVHRLDGALIVTLAIEYPFWNDRCPEVLVRFGPVIAVDSGRSLPADEWTTMIEEALEEAQDDLAEESRRRDPGAFKVLVGGTAGVGGVYDIGRRLRALFGGKRFRSEHTVRTLAGVEPRPVTSRGRTSKG